MCHLHLDVVLGQRSKAGPNDGLTAGKKKGQKGQNTFGL